MVFEFFENLSSIQLTDQVTVLTLFLGLLIIGVGVLIARIARTLFKKYYAPTLPEHSAKNLGKLIYFGIIIISFLVFTQSQGIDLSGIAVGAGIFAIVIGFATQSVVSNLVSGLFLMIEKPAKQGDSIELPDHNIAGTILDIGTFSSQVRKFDGTIIRIPNETVFTSNIRTLTHSQVRRAQGTIGIAYSADIDTAISAIKDEIKSTMPFVLQIPEPEIRVEELGDSSVNLALLVWHPKEDWGAVQPSLLKVAKRALDKAGIEIPFPQRVIWQGQDN